MENSGHAAWTPCCVHTQDRPCQTLTLVLVRWVPSLGLCLIILQPLLVLRVLQHLWGQLLTRATQRQQQGVAAVVVVQHAQDLCAEGRETTYRRGFLTTRTHCPANQSSPPCLPPSTDYPSTPLGLAAGLAAPQVPPGCALGTASISLAQARECHHSTVKLRQHAHGDQTFPLTCSSSRYCWSNSSE